MAALKELVCVEEQPQQEREMWLAVLASDLAR